MLSPHLRRTWRLLLLYALLIFPLSFVLPYWTNVENGPIENTQVLTLLGGCALCLRYGRSASLSLSRMWHPPQASSSSSRCGSSPGAASFSLWAIRRPANPS